MSTIRFLDLPRTISIVTPLALDVSWGDRVSRTQDGPTVFGSVSGAPDGTAGDLRVEVGQRGHWWERQEVTVRGTIDGYDAPLTEEQRAAALATYHAVASAWRAALASDPEIAETVEAYRRIEDGIDAAWIRCREQWERDAQQIAQLFRRVSVEIGEQTVPGKCCVRSRRGKLLGYAHVWDGRWMGTIERI